jgi:HemY protein
MIRLLAILIAAGLLAAGFVWIAERQGDLVFTLDEYEVHMRTAAAIGLALAFAGAVAILTRLVAAIIAGPGAIGAWFNARRMRRGNDALSQGLLAVASGDLGEARRQADRARGILGLHPLALLLQSQSALLAGDETAQLHAYRAMLTHEPTEFLGLRGLFLQAVHTNQQQQALAFAERAHTLKPRVPWAANAVFELKAAQGHWTEARKVLDESARYKLVESNVARRRRAVLLTAEALAADARGDGEGALDLAIAALSLDAGLAPAAVLAARRLATEGKAWRAQGVIEACWALSPHPDLAEAYAAIKPDENHEQRMARLVGLAHLNREHFESRLLEAEEAVLAKNWIEARRLLAPFASEDATARVCALMAEIEEGEAADATAAHAWLARAARAPRDAEWRCSSCSERTTQWAAVCLNCAKFDTLTWSTGIATRPEILPAPAAARKLVPRPAQPAPVITLPHPPDDPGPGGADY